MTILQFLSSPIGATILGAVGKMIANRMNQAAKKEELNAQKDAAYLRAYSKLQGIISNDKFAKNTRRWVFWPLIWSYCFVFIWYAITGGQELPVIVDKKGGILSFIFGGANQEILKTNATFVVYSGVQLIHMIVGFYAIPSKTR